MTHQNLYPGQSPVAAANQTGSVVSGFGIELQPGGSVGITPELSKQPYPEVAGVIETSLSGEGDSGFDQLMLIDMRSVPVAGKFHGHNYKEFGGTMVIEDAAYILVNPALADMSSDKGYKALRHGESFTYGRPTEATPLNDKRHRFAGGSKATSRSHFEISVDEKGVVFVKDTNSTNGTKVLTGKFANEALQSHEHYEKATVLAPNIGAVASRGLYESYRSETADSETRIMTDYEIKDSLRGVAEDASQPELTRELLKRYPELEAKTGIKLGEYTFMFSGIIGGRRKHAIAYVQDAAGKVVPRLFYKSMSEGGWRSTPGLYDDDGTYSKGVRQNYGGYVQNTKPVEQIGQLLELMEGRDVASGAVNTDEVTGLFGLGYQSKHNLNSFESELTITEVAGRKTRGLDAYEPGQGFTSKRDKARHEIANMQLPKGFEPSFSSVEREYGFNHSLAGPTNIRVYNATYNGRAIEWHVAESGSGDTWVDKITFKDAKVTSYGTSSEVILAGTLSAKPFEYSSQRGGGMIAGEDYVPLSTKVYDSLAPLWKQMPWLRRYQAAKQR